MGEALWRSCGNSAKQACFGARGQVGDHPRHVGGPEVVALQPPGLEPEHERRRRGVSTDFLEESRVAARLGEVLRLHRLQRQLLERGLLFQVRHVTGRDDVWRVVVDGIVVEFDGLESE